MSSKNLSYEELTDKIFYSDKYEDDEFEYRHVILPKQLLKLIPPVMFEPGDSGVLRILAESEWRSIGIMQSLGWEHYEVHAPEPWVLLFRRELHYQEKYGPGGKPPAKRSKE